MYPYAYDADYQLTQALPTVLRQEREHAQEGREENFVYGTVGNRLRGPGRDDASLYNELNQLLAGTTEEFRYDANGNLIYRAGLAEGDEQQGWSYEYDLENRLVKASMVGEQGSRVISFKYDPFGRRIEKRVEEAEDGGSEVRVTTYVYDHEDIILEISGNTTSRYVHGPGIDEPLAVEQRRGTYFFHADGLGSIVNLTDQRGRVVQSYEYSAFGRMKGQGEVKQPYGFTGREWDKELGLYYYRARYYDPKAGRFISKDPIGFEGGDVNLYRYVGNDPVLRTDPMGLDDGWDWWGGWPGNGSPLPGYSSQDNICSYPFGFLNKNSCTKRCCKAHDDCYRRFGCNASSWIGGPVTGACQMCNQQAVSCIMRNIDESDCMCGGASGSW